MTTYDFEKKEAFTVAGIGVELKSDYTDQNRLNEEKEAFFNRAMTDGTVDKLREIANNDFLFVVNGVVDDKMMHYVGVQTDEALPAGAREIEFPAGTYIAVPGEAESAYALADQLTQKTFGDVLVKEENYAYVGEPNAAVIMGEAEGVFVGEMWIPVVEK